jgi:hypothetical protein
MTYVKSSLTAPGAYAYVHGKQLYDAYATAIAANGAWTLIDTVTYTDGLKTVEHKVWKCLASSSGLAIDFFVDFYYLSTTSTGVYDSGVHVGIFETYNAGTKQFTKYGPITDGLSYTLAGDRSINVTGTLSSALSTLDPLFAAGCSLEFPAAATDYAISVTSKSIVMSESFDTGFIYVGEFASLLLDASTTDITPLILYTSWSSGNLTSAQGGATTRHPKVTTAAPVVYANAIDNPVGNPTKFTMTNGVPGDPAQADLLHGGPTMSRIVVTHVNTGAAAIATNGRTRGLLRNMATSFSVAAGAVWGDLFTVNGVTHLYLGGNTFLDTTV